MAFLQFALLNLAHGHNGGDNSVGEDQRRSLKDGSKRSKRAVFAEHLADFVLVCVAGYRVALGFDFDDIVSDFSDTGLRVGGN